MPSRGAKDPLFYTHVSRKIFDAVVERIHLKIERTKRRQNEDLVSLAERISALEDIFSKEPPSQKG